MLDKAGEGESTELQEVIAEDFLDLSILDNSGINEEKDKDGKYYNSDNNFSGVLMNTMIYKARIMTFNDTVQTRAPQVKGKNPGTADEGGHSCLASDTNSAAETTKRHMGCLITPRGKRCCGGTE